MLASAILSQPCHWTPLGGPRPKPPCCGPCRPMPREASGSAVASLIRTPVDTRAGTNPHPAVDRGAAAGEPMAPRRRTAPTAKGRRMHAMRVVVQEGSTQSSVRGLRTDAQTPACRLLSRVVTQMTILRVTPTWPVRRVSLRHLWFSCAVLHRRRSAMPVTHCWCMPILPCHS